MAALRLVSVSVGAAGCSSSAAAAGCCTGSISSSSSSLCFTLLLTCSGVVSDPDDVVGSGEGGLNPVLRSWFIAIKMMKLTVKRFSLCMRPEHGRERTRAERLSVSADNLSLVEDCLV